MRILMVNPHFSPINSGSGSVTLTLAKALRSRGHHVAVLSVAVGANGTFKDSVEGIGVHRLPAIAVSFGRLALNYRLPFAFRPGITSRIRAVIESERPEVVHVHGQFWDLNVLAARIAARRGIPVLMSVHTAIVNPNPVVDAALRLVDRHILRRLIRPNASAWTGYDQRVLDYIHDRYQPDNLFYLPNPVATPDLERGDGRRVRESIGAGSRPIVLSLGHVIAGLRDRVLLVYAFAQVLDQIPNALLVVVGRVYDDSFLHIADALGIAESVVAVGEVPRSGVSDWFAAADVECHDLSGVGIGVATIEAMLAGVPVVINLHPTDVPETNEHELQGLAITTSGEPEKVAAELVRLLQSREAATEVSRAGRGFAAARFDHERVATRAEGMYRSVVQRGNVT